MRRNFATFCTLAVLLQLNSVAPVHAQLHPHQIESTVAAENGSAPGRSFTLATLIPNFAAVTDKIWRGAAPSDLALHELRNQGIRTVIDLRRTHRASRHEQNIARQLGITYIHLPMGYGKVDDRDLKEFLDIVRNPVYQPVYVHCRQGADRTGTLVAAYRILVQNWALKKTYAEMRRHHFKPWLFPLKRKVEDIAADQQA